MKRMFWIALLAISATAAAGCHSGKSTPRSSSAPYSSYAPPASSCH